MVEFGAADIQSLSDKIKVFEKMYEVIRFVDPLRKKVLDFKKGAVFNGDSSCFNFWDRGGICDNCISMRAYSENETFVKIEYNGSSIFMVTAVPVTLDGRRIVIEFLKDSTDSMVFGNDDNEKDIEGVHSIINSLNAKALKDPLTGIYNRRYINERLPVDLVNASIYSQELSLIIADLDFFKRVNDTYGHLAGDEVLISFTKCIEGCIRKDIDWAAKFGGEEFLVCLPYTGIEKAAMIAERIRVKFGETDVLYEDKLIKSTASFGVCCATGNKYMNPQELIGCADKNLYKAKSLGRNRVVV